MATNAITFSGFVLTFNGNTIGEIVSINGQRIRNVHEVLSADSTDNAVEKIAGALNEGAPSVQCYYDGSAAGVYNDLNTDFQAGTKGTLLATYSDTSNISVSAIISSLDWPAAGEADGPCMVNVSFECSGKAIFTDVP